MESIAVQDSTRVCEECDDVAMKDRKYCKKHFYKRKAKQIMAHPDYESNKRKYTLKRLYGITPEQYDEMFVKQDGCCAICSTHFSKAKIGNSKYFHVDHDHETDEVRGLLCMPCNVGLGAFQDSPNLLKAATQYMLDGTYGINSSARLN